MLIPRATIERLGIVWAAYPHLSSHELVENAPLTVAGTYNFSGGQSKWGPVGYNVNPTQGGVYTKETSGLLGLTDSWTFAWGSERTTDVTQLVYFHLKEASTTTIEIYEASTNVFLEWRKTSDSAMETRNFSGACDDANGISRAFVITREGGVCKCYRDGVLKSTLTGGNTSALKRTSATNNYLSMSVYNANTTPAWSFYGSMVGGVVAGRAWTHAEAAAWSANPLGILSNNPQQPRLPYTHPGHNVLPGGVS